MPESVSSFKNFAKLGISRQKSKLSPTFFVKSPPENRNQEGKRGGSPPTCPPAPHGLDYLIETIVSSPHALSKNEAKALLRRCAVTGLLFQGAEATACYAACAPLLSSRASQEELADSISKNGSLSGIAELVSPITARKNRRKSQYEYSTQIAINMSRLRRFVVSLGLQ